MNPKYCCEVEPENVPDLVAVIRCKDCRFNNNPEERASETYWMPCEEFVTDGNWFCGWGKPKDGDGI